MDATTDLDPTWAAALQLDLSADDLDFLAVSRRDESRQRWYEENWPLVVMLREHHERNQERSVATLF